MDQDQDNASTKLAIIGMSGRFPGARSIDEFWANLVGEVESIRFFTDEEWEAGASLKPTRDASDEAEFVRARGILEDVELFDAEFFGYRPRDVAVMDPQQRLFLEQSWAALEHAGYDPARYEGAIGVYGGVSRNTYLLNNVQHAVGRVDSLDDRLLETGNERDYLASRVAYQLDLHGPAVAVHSACSTSLLAIHYACQDLLSYQCDIALAGGASVRVPQVDGYVHTEGSILSHDGHCRPFDRDASGTNVGNGVGIVALKRLDEAVRDGDMIWAVVAGSAVNNDGHNKLSFMAPSVEGQAEVIAAAMAAADVRPDDISYVECHGTGTPLGDLIEVAGLRQAFGKRAGPPCGIGSVKSNIGHLDAAAGVAGFIKAVLALHHKRIPATLHYRNPNPECGLDDGTFSVVAETMAWDPPQGSRRAGVSAFGLGGTNVHAILEEAPTRTSAEPTVAGSAARAHVLPLSARTEASLARSIANLADHLAAERPALADVAYTLQDGRRHFEQRASVVAASIDEAVSTLRGRASAGLSTKRLDEPTVAFVFPGGGSQHVGMAADLYRSEQVFRVALDQCAEILRELGQPSLIEAMYPGDGRPPDRGHFERVAIALPALFSVEYALARTWAAFGVRPTAMIGHSLGEYVAATLAGVFSLESGLAIVVERSRLMESAPPGVMLSVALPANEVERYLSEEVSLAVVNTAASSVLSGSAVAMTTVAARLEADGVEARPVPISVASHSVLMESVLEPFRQYLGGISMERPQIPFVSNTTGSWISEDDAVDPDYWVKHLRNTVRFTDGLGALLGSGAQVLIEVGPSQVLSGLVRRHPGFDGAGMVIPSLPHPGQDVADDRHFLARVGAAWEAGVSVDWGPTRTAQSAGRIGLPTYSFDRQRYWVEPESSQDRTQQRGTIVTGTIPSSQTADGEAGKVEMSTTVHPSEDRAERILNELLEIFRDMSGLEIAGSDVDTRFQDLGFDSLFLAQANAELRSRFKVRIGFRQLLDDASTPAALAEFIDAAMPPDKHRAGPTDPRLVPVSGPSESREIGARYEAAGDQLSQPIASIRSLVGNAPDGLMVIAQKHLELMEAQLRLLSDAGVRSAVQPALVAASREDDVPDQGRKPVEFVPVPVTTGATSAPKPRTDLSDQQREGISALVTRYTARTHRSQEFAEEARVHLADNRAIVGYRTAWKDLAYQVVTAESSGARLRDIDGNEYIDILNSMGANLLGHRFEPIVHALEDLLHQGFEVGPQTLLARDVADKVCAMTGSERLTFAHTGCEAVQYAVRMARAATDRSKVMFFDGDVHGRGDLFIARSFEADGRLKTMPTAPGVPRANVSESMVMQYGSERALEMLRSMGNDIAAVLVEPVRTRNPDLQPIEFLREVRKITEELGICLIFDEVVTGFRVHPGGAQAYFDIDADIATYGKVLGGGLPIGAVAGRREFLDYADGGVWSFGDDSVPESAVTRVGGTMIKHPLSLAAAKAVLETLEESGPDLQRELNRRTTEFTEQVNARFVEDGVPIHIEQFASIFKPVFLDGPEFEALFYAHLRDRGVHAYADFPCFFTTAHTVEDIGQVAEAFVDAAEEMSGFGLLDKRPQGVSPAAVRLGHNDEGIVTGSMPLLPNQHRFLIERASPHPNSWGIFGVRSCLVRLDEEHVRRACSLLIRQHDALRTRLVADGDRWNVYIDEPPTDVPFSVHRIDASDAAAAERRVEEEVLKLRSSISLSDGPLLRMALFDLGETAPQQVYLMAHHLASDGLSWIRLWEDFEDAYDHVSRGVGWHPPKTDSYRTWAYRLDALAQEPATIRRADDWLALPWESVRALPQDFAVDAAQNTNGSVGVLQVHLDADVSRALDRVRIDYRADLLVGAIAEGVSDWSGNDTVLLDVLGHGREEDLFGNADVSRTVGFFAWYTPHVLRRAPSGPDQIWTTTALPQIEAIRQKGALSHDLLRYLTRDEQVSRRMQALPRSEILVNWQGRFDGVFPETHLFADSRDPGRASDMPDGTRAYLLSIRGDIIDKQWVVTFVYSSHVHRESTIQQLAERVRHALEQAAASSP